MDAVLFKDITTVDCDLYLATGFVSVERAQSRMHMDAVLFKDITTVVA